jgi:ADP-heptose:LPS heptosyltransferase
MSPPDWSSVRRVLAIRLDNLGDVLMTGPALRALAGVHPDAHLTLLASPGGAAAAALLPEVDEVMVHRALWQDASGAMPLDPSAELALVERLAAGRFDAAVVFTSFAQSPHPPAYACYLAGIPVRVGQSKEFAGGVLSCAVAPPPDDLHQAERNIGLLEGAGLPARERDLQIVVPPDAAERAADVLMEVGVWGQPYVVLAPGASAPSRRYEPARFAAAARSLVHEDGLRVVVVGSERERGLVEEVAGAAGGGAVALAGRTGVPELAALIEGGELLLANNSGTMHLAEALGRPMTILFAGTELERQWRPRSAPATLLRRPTACSPCYAFACPYALECLDVPVAEVLEAARSLLGLHGAGTSPATPVP